MTALPSFIEYVVCTTPLPYVFSPTIVPLPVSCIAPDKSSDADALPPLTSTTKGISNSPSLEYIYSFFPFLSSVYVIIPLGIISSATFATESTNPPGLSLKSIINDLTPFFFKSL